MENPEGKGTPRNKTGSNSFHCYDEQTVVRLAPAIVFSFCQLLDLAVVRLAPAIGFSYWGERGWCSGKSTRLPPMWPGFDSRTRRHVWVEFVVGSRPCSEGFSPGRPVFPPSSKTNVSKFQFDLESEGHRFVSSKTVKCHPRLLNKVNLYQGTLLAFSIPSYLTAIISS